MVDNVRIWLRRWLLRIRFAVFGIRLVLCGGGRFSLDGFAWRWNDYSYILFNARPIISNIATFRLWVCDRKISRTVELDKPFTNDEESDLESRFDLPDESANPANIYADLESFNMLIAAFKRLEPSDQTLFKLMGTKARKATIAEKLGMTLDGVRYRENRLRKILRSDPTLKDILKFPD